MLPTGDLEPLVDDRPAAVVADHLNPRPLSSGAEVVSSQQQALAPTLQGKDEFADRGVGGDVEARPQRAFDGIGASDDFHRNLTVEIGDQVGHRVAGAAQVDIPFQRLVE